MKYFAFMFVVLFFGQHIRIALKRGANFRFYVALLVLTVCGHFGAFHFLRSQLSVHIHHYYWATVLACMARFEHDSSFAAQFILNAVMLHGFAAFGPDPVFKAPKIVLG